MGILILPFILGAIIITIASLVIVIKQIIQKQIGFQEFFFGLLTSIIIFGFILGCYKLVGSAWALSTGFVIPIFLFGMPFIAYVITRLYKVKKLPSILLTSVLFSGILASLFFDIYFDFFDLIGVKKIF